MLTREENELLTRVGPGTPAGELLRRYWQPVAMLPEVSAETPTKHVRILGEDLVLFRDKSGRVGLLADHCSHRGASLLYGRVEERGIACAYHGWLYDVNGSCLETPAEPAESLFHLTVKHRSYPIQQYCGLYWAYMGPPPAPLLPRIDVVEMVPIKAVGQSPVLDCNWLQFVEQNLDQAHIFILHQSTRSFAGQAEANTTRGRIDELANVEYVEVPFGIKRTQVHRSGWLETDLMVFPTTLRIYDQFSVKVPVDDTHTRQFHVYGHLESTADKGGENMPWNRSRTKIASSDGVDYYVDSGSGGKSPPDAIHPFARYRMDNLRFQDYTVLETQGPIAARENEHLGTSDRGVVLLRTIFKREIEKVQRGLDPVGVVRDPEQAFIDTYLQSYIATASADPR